MRTPLLVAIALVLSLPAPSDAQAPRLQWNDCGDGGALDNAFSCSNNSALHFLVSSFVAPIPMTHFIGSTTEIILASDVAGMPSWWRMDESGCRAGALSSEDPLALGTYSCANPFAGSMNLGLSHFEANYGGDPHRAKIIVDLARSDAGVPLVPGTEYLANVIQIRSTKTTGAGACEGCSQTVCLELERVIVAEPQLSIELRPNGISWPSGVSWHDSQGATCFSVIPTRKATWGGIKSLYR